MLLSTSILGLRHIPGTNTIRLALLSWPAEALAAGAPTDYHPAATLFGEVLSMTDDCRQHHRRFLSACHVLGTVCAPCRASPYFCLRVQLSLERSTTEHELHPHRASAAVRVARICVAVWVHNEDLLAPGTLLVRGGGVTDHAPVRAGHSI